ncbi:hypothetical protein C8D89_1123 [Actinomycetospora cinnamomea]|uniref:Uncharacterized protein n=2 Tax=Actinomycetospora cinnamomea TaxID=663609 RepID=A0A2U1F457_9PSEU|nr:hypothetical protein C8D89_1123 [Actinomycetospora cinnamomea]
MVATDARGTDPGTMPVLEDGPGTHPAIAARLLERSLAPSARDVVGARLRTRGVARIGRAWWPYRGHEVTLPRHGYFRELRVAGVLRVVDSWVAGRARRRTTLLGRCLHPALVGPDLARADLAHAALSAMWVPSVLQPSESVCWSVEDRDTAAVAFDVAGTAARLRLTLHRGGLPRRVTTARWGDPDGSGFFRDVPFGVEVLEHRTFHGLTVPSTGVLGWRLDSPGPVREVLRFQITDLEPVHATGPVLGEMCDLDAVPDDIAEGEIG